MTICDKCGSELNPPVLQQAGRRICADCGKRIRKRERWFIGVDGRLRHRDCKMPTGTPVAETMNLPI
jgi:hypothetical protein